MVCRGRDPAGVYPLEIKDSKLLSAQQREKLAPVIRQESVCWGLGVVEVDEIDRINILKASLLAMVKALAALTATVDCALIDGNQPIPAPLFHLGNFSTGKAVYQKTIIKGDQLCLSIAAASILAKVARDRRWLTRQPIPIRSPATKATAVRRTSRAAALWPIADSPASFTGA